MKDLKFIRKSKPWTVIPEDKMPGVVEQIMSGIPYSEVARQWCCTPQCVKDSVKRYNSRR